MFKLRILGSVALAVLMLAAVAMAQRTGGGAARSGMRGAMVGGMVGGSGGAATGAKIGVAAGVTQNVAQRSQNRQAMNSETQSRTQYESSAAYQNTQHSNFNDSPPNVLATTAVVAAVTPGTPASRNATTTTTTTTTPATTMPATPAAAAPATPAVAAAQAGEAIVRKAGKPVVGITYPDDWKQKAGESFVTATSPEGNAWAVIARIDDAKDKDAGIKIVKDGLDKYLQEIQYDEPTTTERGALLVTGSGKIKKTGLPVVFATGVFNVSPQQIAGAAFFADENVEDQYKEAVRFMCQTIRGESDFTEQPHEVAKPVIRDQK